MADVDEDALSARRLTLSQVLEKVAGIRRLTIHAAEQGEAFDVETRTVLYRPVPAQQPDAATGGTHSEPLPKMEAVELPLPLALQPNGGRVGVGTRTPGAILEVRRGRADGNVPALKLGQGGLTIERETVGATTSLVVEPSPSGDAVVLQASGTELQLHQPGALESGTHLPEPERLHPGPSTRMVAVEVPLALQPGGGNVGLGTRTPGAALDISHAGAQPGLRIQGTAEGGTELRLEDGTRGQRASFGISLGKQGLHVVDRSAGAERLTIDREGRVGVGTQAPAGSLEVVASTPGPVLALRSTAGTGVEIRMEESHAGDGHAHLITASAGHLRFRTVNAENTVCEHLVITPSGKLQVANDIELSNGADCAEEFPVGAEADVAPGMVMSICEDGALRPSRRPYDRCVAGVISGAGSLRPAITLCKRPEPGRVPVALAGTVYCLADASGGAIGLGDLLTTSSTAGHAMRATDPLRAFGAVLGKAMGELREGSGLIPVLVALQ